MTEFGGEGTVTGEHACSAPGAYTLTVIDGDGGYATSEFRYIVLFDPEGAS